MRSPWLLLIVLAAASAACGDDGETTPAGPDAWVFPDLPDAAPPPDAPLPPDAAIEMTSLIVVLSDEVTDVPTTVTTLTMGRDATVGAIWETALKGFVVELPVMNREALCASAEVARCDDDLPITAFCHVGDEVTPIGITQVGARTNLLALGGSIGVDVAVLDSGIHGGSEDLRIARAFECTTAGQPCTPLADPLAATDAFGHGTRVAGIIGADDDEDRLVGVAPGARIWSYRVLDNNGEGRWSTLISGLDAVAQDAGSVEIANISAGGTFTDVGADCASSALHLAVCGVTSRGVLVVAGAGNGRVDAAGVVPAVYDQVLTVSATDVNNLFASFSNFGEAVDIAAPGAHVLSLSPTGARGGGCLTTSGTSLAAAHVAGAAALWIAAHGRDCDLDGSKDAADTECIAEQLIRLGTCPGGLRTVGSNGECSTGWSGDLDDKHEPMVNVADPF